MTVGGMGFIPERLLMMMMMMNTNKINFDIISRVHIMMLCCHLKGHTHWHTIQQQQQHLARHSLGQLVVHFLDLGHHVLVQQPGNAGSKAAPDSRIAREHGHHLQMLLIHKFGNTSMQSGIRLYLRQWGCIRIQLGIQAQIHRFFPGKFDILLPVSLPNTVITCSGT